MVVLMWRKSDALGVGVMLDVARVVVDRKRPFDNSILFGELWSCSVYDESRVDFHWQYGTVRKVRVHEEGRARLARSDICVSQRLCKMVLTCIRRSTILPKSESNPVLQFQADTKYSVRAVINLEGQLQCSPIYDQMADIGYSRRNDGRSGRLPGY